MANAVHLKIYMQANWIFYSNATLNYHDISETSNNYSLRQIIPLQLLNKSYKYKYYLR